MPKRHFNQALGALLACAQELGEYMESRDPALQYPYQLVNNKLASVSGLHSNDEETWTRAMKYLLTDLKWALVFAAKHREELEGT